MQINKIYLLLLVILLFLANCSPKRGTMSTHQGKVLETIDSGGYTYVRINENGKDVWAASMPFKVATGDMVRFEKRDPMKDFISPSLRRTFATIYFTDKIYVNNEKKGLSDNEAIRMPHSKIDSTAIKINIQAGSVKKVKGGYTVAELYSHKSTLKGKTIKIRGRVVKFNAKIMGHNWIHIQDGTGKDKTGMIAATTDATVKLGDTVLLNGKIIYNKDFGSGYIYPALIENATVTVE